MPQVCEFARRLLQKYNKSADLQVSSYDIIAPPWAYIPDPEFAAHEKLPNLLANRLDGIRLSPRAHTVS
jgi:hypothetical protein